MKETYLPMSTGQGHIQREKGGTERERRVGGEGVEREVKVNTYMCGVLCRPPAAITMPLAVSVICQTRGREIIMTSIGKYKYRSVEIMFLN